MSTTQTNRGGAGRGQGRKPLKAGEGTVTVTVKMTDGQKAKLARLGGALGGAAWVRARIDKAREPSTGGTA